MNKQVKKLAKRLTRGSQPGRARNASAGRYRAGHKKSGGRKKGVQNIMTRELKEAILHAASRHGEDGKGLNGLEGYMFLLASVDRKIFGTLLRAVLPLQADVVVREEVMLKTEGEVKAALLQRGLPESMLHRLEFHDNKLLELDAAEVEPDRQ
jgi:hypothetical protein